MEEFKVHIANNARVLASFVNTNDIKQDKIVNIILNKENQLVLFYYE